MADSTKKRKKKSRKSKHKDHSSPAVPTNCVEFSAHQDDEESTRPSKRKHESSEHEQKKKRKKKKTKYHEAENDVNGASINMAEADHSQLATSQSEGPVSRKPPKPLQSTVDKTHVTVTAPSSQAESTGHGTTGEINSRGRPKKQRGSRPGEKDNLKIGFYEPEEIERLEKFKLDFCNTHGIPGEQFDMMVQHSEREDGEFPCDTSITSKSEFWADIYNIIPDRNRRSVYRFMRRHFQPTTQKPHEWTDEQDEELIRLHAEHGAKWVVIARLLGRSDDDVTQRWKNKLEHRHTMRRGPWSEDELRAFMDAMQKMWEGYKEVVPESAGKDVYEMDEKLVAWGAISNTMKNVRSRQQCADKWRKIRRAVFAKRRDGFPDAVFDYTKVAKRSTRPIGEPKSGKSQEFVVEDDDDEGNVGDDSLPTSAATTPAPKFGIADQQLMLTLAAAVDETSAESPSAPQQNTEMDADSDAEVNGRPEEPDTPAAVNGTSPVTPVTPMSATNGQKRDAGRMARIKEKIKEANKSSSSKKRKRAEASPEPEQDAEVEQPEEQLSTVDKQSERERKKEKKRKKKERKAQEELKRIEAEAEAEAPNAAAKQAAESKKKEKHKKKRKSADAAAVVEAVAAATPKKRKKHRKSESEAEVNGAIAEEPEPSESPRKKDKEDKKQAVQEADGEGGSERQSHENTASASVVDDDQAQSDQEYSSDDGSIKEETESD